MNVGLAAKAMFLCLICQTIICFIKQADARGILTVVSTYVHDTFKSEEIHIDQITTGWEQLTVEISHSTQNAKKIIISNIYRPPERYVVELDLFISEF